MRRIFYLLSTNAAVMAVMSVIILLLPPEIRAQHGMFLVIAGVMGIGGAIVSLLSSKQSAIKRSRVQLIDKDSPRNETEQWLLRTVERQAREAGIGMPDVGVFPAAEMNAFATGANKNNALVAVSAGLLQSMTREEAEAVLGHEIAHVANGDMITLTLIMGVVNTFVMVLARALAMFIDRDGRGFGYNIGFMVGQALFGFLASIIVGYFSRMREYRADEGGAKYSSAQNMIAALERLQHGKPSSMPRELAAFGINGGLKSLFATHPPLEDRINALKNNIM